jgi:hypothetical protein
MHTSTTFSCNEQENKEFGMPSKTRRRHISAQLTEITTLAHLEQT